MWDALLFGLIISVLIILSPIIILLVAYTYVQEKMNNKRFETYLTTIEGAKYFCYTNRQTSQKYVEANIVPYLPPNTEIIYLGDSKRTIVLGDDTKFLFHIVGKMRMTKGGYPYVGKVLNGQLVTMSVNDRLYNAIKRKKDADVINDRIRRFLQSPKISSPIAKTTSKKSINLSNQK